MTLNQELKELENYRSLDLYAEDFAENSTEMENIFNNGQLRNKKIYFEKE